MSGTVILEIAGVLRTESNGPISEGITLYTMLAAQHRIVLVGVDADLDQAWLKQFGLTEHVQLLIGAVEVGVRRTRGQGAVDLVISASPATIAACMHMGTTSLLFAHPKYARPEFREDYDGAKREWSAIVAELDTQNTVSARIPQNVGDDA